MTAAWVLRNLCRSMNIGVTLPLQLWTHLCLASWSAIITSHLLLLWKSCCFEVRTYLKKGPWKILIFILFTKLKQVTGSGALYLTFEHSSFSGPSQLPVFCLIFPVGTCLFVHVSNFCFQNWGTERNDYLSIFLCKQSR